MNTFGQGVKVSLTSYLCEKIERIDDLSPCTEPDCDCYRVTQELEPKKPHSSIETKAK